jgi:ABC-2 type transport system permease protein
MTTITTGGPALGLRMVGNEILKGLQVTWRRRATLVPQIAFVTVLYWTMQYFVGGGRIVPELAAQTLGGYLAFTVTYIALLRMAAGLLEEMFTGTFMQSMLSPLRPWVLTTGRLLAALIEGVLSALVVAVLFVPLLSIDISFRWEVVVPAVLVVVDAAGFALFLGGLALIVNGIGAIIHVLWSMLLLVNGAFVPVDSFPLWLGVIAKIWPTTLAVDVAKKLMFDGASLTGLWSDYTLPLATGHAVLMLLLGWAVFHAAVRRGLKIGRLGP